MLPLARDGFDVRVIVATVPCPDPGPDHRLPLEEDWIAASGGGGKYDWMAMLASFYQPFRATAVAVEPDGCPCVLTKLTRAIAAADHERLSAGTVILSRPDLVWRPREVRGIVGATPPLPELQQALQALPPRRAKHVGKGKRGNKHHRLRRRMDATPQAAGDLGVMSATDGMTKATGPRSRSLRQPEEARQQPAAHSVVLPHEFRFHHRAPAQYTPPRPVLNRLVQRGRTVPAMIFPFPCERQAWGQYHCVADTLMSMPGPVFAVLRAACLGRYGCFGPPRSHQPKSCARDPSLPLRKDVLPDWLVQERHLRPLPPTSGHGCLLCLRGALDSLLAQADLNSSVLLPEGFLDKEQRHVNTRWMEGINPLYFMAGDEELPTLSKALVERDGDHTAKNRRTKKTKGLARWTGLLSWLWRGLGW